MIMLCCDVGYLCVGFFVVLSSDLFLILCDTLAWATGTRVGASDHAIALFCIEYGCVLGLYFDTLHFEV